MIVALATHYVMQGVEVADEMLRRRTLMVQGGYPPADLDMLCPLPPSFRFYDRVWERDTAWTWRLAGVWLAWPWLVFVTMLLFRVSMRRARIRPTHVLRCVLYSCDALLWLGVTVVTLVALRALHLYGLVPPRVLVPPAPVPGDHFFRYTPHPVTDALFWGAFLMLILTGYRLATAFRMYLRLDHPAATAVAAYLIAALFLLVALVQGWV